MPKISYGMTTVWAFAIVYWPTAREFLLVHLEESSDLAPFRYRDTLSNDDRLEEHLAALRTGEGQHYVHVFALFEAGIPLRDLLRFSGHLDSEMYDLKKAGTDEVEAYRCLTDKFPSFYPCDRELAIAARRFPSPKPGPDHVQADTSSSSEEEVARAVKRSAEERLQSAEKRKRRAERELQLGNEPCPGPSGYRIPRVGDPPQVVQGSLSASPVTVPGLGQEEGNSSDGSVENSALDPNEVANVKAALETEVRLQLFPDFYILPEGYPRTTLSALDIRAQTELRDALQGLVNALNKFATTLYSERK